MSGGRRVSGRVTAGLVVALLLSVGFTSVASANHERYCHELTSEPDCVDESLYPTRYCDELTGDADCVPPDEDECETEDCVDPGDGCTPTEEQIEQEPDLAELLDKDVVVVAYHPEKIYEGQTAVIKVDIKNCLPYPIDVTFHAHNWTPDTCEIGEPGTDAQSLPIPAVVAREDHFVMDRAGGEGLAPYVNSDQIGFDVKARTLQPGLCHIETEVHAVLDGDVEISDTARHAYVDVEELSENADLGGMTVRNTVNCDNRWEANDPGTVEVADGDVTLSAYIEWDGRLTCGQSGIHSGFVRIRNDDGNAIAWGAVSEQGSGSARAEAEETLAGGNSYTYHVDGAYIDGLTWTCRISIAVAVGTAGIATGAALTAKAAAEVLGLAIDGVGCLQAVASWFNAGYDVTVDAINDEADCETAKRQQRHVPGSEDQLGSLCQIVEL